MAKQINYAQKGRRYLARVRRAREIRERQIADARNLGITPRALEVLAYLVSEQDCEPDKEIYTGEVIEKLNVPPAEISKPIGELIDMRYIANGICHEDRRRVVLKPTEMGIGKYHSLFEKSEE